MKSSQLRVLRQEKQGERALCISGEELHFSLKKPLNPAIFFVYYKDEQLRYWSILAALTHMFNHVNTELMQATQEILSEQLHFNFTEKKSTKTIYTLTDPRDGKVFWVGVTEQKLHRRLTSHHCEYRHRESPKNDLVKEILHAGYRVQIDPVEEVYEEDWIDAEQYWIEQFKAWGFKLYNKAKGGHGNSGGNPWNKGLKTGPINKGSIKHHHLTSELLHEIRKMYVPKKFSYQKIADKYMVSTAVAFQIINKIGRYANR